MNGLEEVRLVCFSTFKALHNASFPSMPINWPNFSTVDAESLTGPFISVQLSFRFGTEIADVTAIDDMIKGELLVSYLRPTGSGLTGSWAYADMLRAGLCNKKIGGITYYGLKVLDVSPAPGIVGHMNVIPFMVG